MVFLGDCIGHCLFFGDTCVCLPIMLSKALQDCCRQAIRRNASTLPWNSDGTRRNHTARCILLHAGSAVPSWALSRSHSGTDVSRDTLSTSGACLPAHPAANHHHSQVAIPHLRSSPSSRLCVF